MNAAEYFEPHTETLDREQLRARQLRLLQVQLRRCTAASEFYRQRFGSAGVDVDAVRSFDDVRLLPLLTKADLRCEQAEHGTFGRYACALPSEWRAIHPSSGTTGTPVNTLWTAGDLAIIATTAARTLWTIGCRPGDVILNCFTYGLWVAGIAVHQGAQHLGACVIPAGSARVDHLVKLVEALRPTIFTGTPSLGLYLAQRLDAAGRSARCSLRIGAFGGEPGVAVPTTRRRVEAELGIRAHDYYGLSEIGPALAAECLAQAGLHWNEDHLLIEVLDPRTARPVEAGTPGILTITNLTRVGTPLIRFSTGDIAALDERRCECGRTLARSPGGVLGRADDLINFRGTKFYPAQVEKVLRAFAALGADYRIDLRHEQGRDRCVISVEMRDSMCPRSDELAVEVSVRIRDEILVRPEVRLRGPGELRQETGKPVRAFDERPERLPHAVR